LTTAGDRIVQALEANGVTVVFGLIGSSTLEIFDALGRSSIRFIGVRDERSGVAMADGYARASNRIGVFLAGQNGPGVTNTVTTLALAKLSYSPVVVLGGAVSRSHEGRDAFQELDQSALMAPVSKAYMRVSTGARAGEAVREAIRVATSGRRGPVFVDLPRDVLAEDVTGVEEPWLTAPTAEPPSMSSQQADRAAQLIASKPRRVIVAGAGVKWSDAGPLVERFASQIGAMLLTSAGNRDAVNNEHELFFGQFGPRGSAGARALISEADVIIGLGTRFGFNSSFYSSEYVPRRAALVQVDIDAGALGRYFPIDLGIQADARDATESLLAACDVSKVDPSTSWISAISEARGEWLAQRTRESEARAEPVVPQEFLRWLSTELPRDTIVTIDAGTCGLMAAEALDFHKPRTLFTPLDFGCLGFAHPAAIGAQLAVPDASVISIGGDGGFGFAVAELATAVENRLPVVSLVLDNHAWGAEKAYQRDFFGGRYVGADLAPVRFDRVAEAYGARGFYATAWGEVPCIKPLFQSDLPTVVQVEVDAEAIRSFRVDSFAGKVKAPA
jgi:thiamine pyrophosphate-dependent acetolactate synthase large subunit-like protein